MTEKTTREQAAHLMQRIEAFWASHRHPGNPPEPAKVVAARKLIADYETKCEAARKAHVIAVMKVMSTTREAVHFKSAEEALAAVKKLEATQF